jgi:hypothetical protein
MCHRQGADPHALPVECQILDPQFPDMLVALESLGAFTGSATTDCIRNCVHECIDDYL